MKFIRIRYARHYSISYFFFAFHGYSDHYIFSCLEQNNITAIEQETRRGNVWKTIHNKANETVVQVAIRKQNIEALKILIEHGALVAVEDVHYYVQVFFGVDSAFFKTGYNELLDSWFNLSTQTVNKSTALLSALATAKTIEQEKDIISIMNFFVNPEEISLHLGLLTSPISKTPLIIKNFKNIFFQENTPNNLLLKTIIKNLQTGDNAHALLSFLIDLKIFETKNILHLPAPPQNTPVEYKQSENVAAALMEHSREHYQQIPNNAPFRFIIYEIPHPALLSLIEFSDRLSIFVERSITSRKKYKSKIKTYKFWHQVYNSLVIRGDFMNSFSIAVGLGHSAVQKAIRDDNLALIQIITDPTNSFKKYRDATKLHSQGSYLPSIQIMLKDLASLKEVGFFVDRGLKPEVLPFLVRHKQEMVQTLSFARQTKFLSDDLISKAINLLPNSDIATKTLLWQRIYRTIIKGQTFAW